MTAHVGAMGWSNSVRPSLFHALGKIADDRWAIAVTSAILTVFGLDKRNEICPPHTVAANHCKNSPKNNGRDVFRCTCLKPQEIELPDVLNRPRVRRIAGAQAEACITHIPCAGLCPASQRKLVIMDCVHQPAYSICRKNASYCEDQPC